MWKFPLLTVLRSAYIATYSRYGAATCVGGWLRPVREQIRERGMRVLGLRIKRNSSHARPASGNPPLAPPLQGWEQRPIRNSEQLNVDRSWQRGDPSAGAL